MSRRPRESRGGAGFSRPTKLLGLLGCAAVIAQTAAACGHRSSGAGVHGQSPATSGGVSGRGTGGRSGRGGESEGGAGGGCPTSYDLPSYYGNTQGLCDALENSECCMPPEDVTGVFYVVCAPDGSFCTAGAPCSVVGDPPRRQNCGWNYCPIDAAGAAGEATAECPPSLVEAALSGVGPSVCVSDADCLPDEVCNQRHANRMFCGPAVSP